jgi:hypothetical protein
MARRWISARSNADSTRRNHPPGASFGRAALFQKSDPHRLECSRPVDAAVARRSPSDPHREPVFSLRRTNSSRSIDDG